VISVASQSGSKVLVVMLDVMLPLSVSLWAITPGCKGGEIWMLCSLVAWEEEEEDWRCLVTSVEPATSTSGRVLLFRRQNKSLLVASAI
jgi:hypothetical protein